MRKAKTRPIPKLCIFAYYVRTTRILSNPNERVQLLAFPHLHTGEAWPDLDGLGQQVDNGIRGGRPRRGQWGHSRAFFGKQFDVTGTGSLPVAGVAFVASGFVRRTLTSNIAVHPKLHLALQGVPDAFCADQTSDTCRKGAGGGTYTGDSSTSMQPSSYIELLYSAALPSGAPSVALDSPPKDAAALPAAVSSGGLRMRMISMAATMTPKRHMQPMTIATTACRENPMTVKSATKPPNLKRIHKKGTRTRPHVRTIAGSLTALKAARLATK